MNYFDYNALFGQLINESVDPETGEIINPDFEAQLAALQMDKEEKVEQAALAFKNLTADIDTIDKVMKALKAKKEKKEKSKAFFHDWIESQLDGKKLKTALVSVYSSKTTKTEIIDASLIPDEFLKVETSIQKDAIKKAIQSGIKVPGAKVVDSTYIVIK